MTSTKSVLGLQTTGADDGATLKCRAESPSLPHLTQDYTTTLSVNCEYLIFLCQNQLNKTIGIIVNPFASERLLLEEN